MRFHRPPTPRKKSSSSWPGPGQPLSSTPIRSRFAIVILLAIVTVSYEQIIHAYPGGGGAYIVARDNLGELPAQVAGASLLTDYILTVAVSISAGVAQVTSAFPALYDYRVEIAVGLVLFMMVVNLRGVRESGTAFAIPSYFFLAMMSLTVGIGLVKYALGTLGVVSDPPHLDVETFQAISLFLILHAFASGTTALTGVEAISNGITAFRVPRSKNAGITLIWMSSILAVLFLGITFLSVQVGAVPSEHETVISQLARTVFDGRNAIYLAVVGATMVILIMAANTSFNGFPRLECALGARWFFAAPTGVSRQPAGVFPRHRGAGIGRLRVDHRLPGKRHRFDPAICDRRVPVVHPLAGRHGPTLA